VPALEVLEAGEEALALGHDHRLVVGLGHHLHGLERDAGTHGIGVERRMGRADRERLRIDHGLFGPHTGERVEAVRHRLAEDEGIRTTPKCSMDQSLPVRKKPIWISSTTRRMPWFVENLLQAF